MSKTKLDIAQDITTKITTVFSSLSCVAFIAMAATTDPKVRKGSMGVMAVWFVLCLVNMIISSINAGKKGISLVQSMKGGESTYYSAVGSSSG
jgi:hypothetical protein